MEAERSRTPLRELPGLRHYHRPQVVTSVIAPSRPPYKRMMALMMFSCMGQQKLICCMGPAEASGVLARSSEGRRTCLNGCKGMAMHHLKKEIECEHKLQGPYCFFSCRCIFQNTLEELMCSMSPFHRNPESLTFTHMSRRGNHLWAGVALPPFEPEARKAAINTWHASSVVTPPHSRPRASGLQDSFVTHSFMVLLNQL